ncbi:hypothetical protein [Deinococcus roseus]|uniref:Uncharacterized protein n=1 Tax=Deinococcus roseus TaxID=392414 RepID=A0ABQ2DDM3_9DEIO|nr:hypothetical protein [Deinococcus roseus]GGJ54636.1 hypothetical protein GCM10008938_45900 [Deinococcus roseus]
MSGIALQKPLPRPRRDHRTFWALFSIGLVILIAMMGLPVVNTFLATSSDLSGTWTCMSTCPKATSFTLRGGGVYREADGKVEQIGYWKWKVRSGLLLKARTETQKPFKWLFFNSMLYPTVQFRWWTGAPQFCVDEKRVWCYVKSEGF